MSDSSATGSFCQAAGGRAFIVSRRPISLRAYDRAHWMTGALVCEGVEVREHIERQLEDPRVAVLHLHNAKQGCYSCSVERA